MPNRLASEASPYLRDHADNPVDWYPWGDEALNKAKTEDKPIFLSIGYSACHWYHVMARESFSDPKIAEILNANYVSIKVDREERPDVDEVYIEAVRILTGSAGWPLSVFLTPELKPFYGGTYFPPEPRPGMAAFNRVLLAALHYFRTQRHEIDEAGNRIAVELNRLSTLPDHEGQMDETPLRGFYKQRLEVFDSEHGGFGVAPKFPNPTDLALLLKLSRRPGFDQARAIVELTLHKMAEGGIYDQLGGGFHRYSTDTIWLVPHFEKMLYDNALLAQTYARAFQVTGEESYRAVAEETLAWMEREMLLPDGGFAAALDADTGGREGAYYTWTEEQVRQAVGPDLARLACDFYGASAPGSFEGTNVLHTAVPVEQLLSIHHLGIDELWPKLEEIRAKLLGARNRRPALRRDDKVLADWNGLALSAFARCSVILGSGPEAGLEPQSAQSNKRVRTDSPPSPNSFGSVTSVVDPVLLAKNEHYLDVARSLSDFILAKMVSGNEVAHFLKPGAADVPGQLSDLGFVAQGLLDLFDACYDVRYIEAAIRLTDRMIELFFDAEGGLFTTRSDSPGILSRLKNGYDGAIPSGNSVAVMNLLRLARLCGRNDYERAASATLRRFYETMVNYPPAFSMMLAGLDLLLHPGTEVVLFLPGPSPDADAMATLLASAPDEYRTSVVIKASQPDESTRRLIPLTHGRTATDKKPTAFVCRNQTCYPPVHTAAELAVLLVSK